jgi:hypothetical protein
MKSLEKDRRQRYESPMELAADLERWIRKDPVLAGPPGLATRVRKVLRRRRVLVRTVLAASVTLVLGFVVARAFFVPGTSDAGKLQEDESTGPGQPTATVEFRTTATVLRVEPRGDLEPPLRTPLRSWDVIEQGEYIALEVEVDRESWVYLFNEDEIGGQNRLFPSPDVQVQNPLPPGKHVLPSPSGAWPISNDGGGAEHFLIVVGKEPVDFTEELVAKIKPALLSEAAQRSLTRSAGAPVELGSSPEWESPRLTDQIRPLEEGKIEVTEGALVRAFHLRNPSK